MNDQSNWTLRSNRTLREAGIQPLTPEPEEPRWYAVCGWASIAVMLSWLFLVVVLGWPA